MILALLDRLEPSAGQRAVEVAGSVAVLFGALAGGVHRVVRMHG